MLPLTINVRRVFARSWSQTYGMLHTSFQNRKIHRKVKRSAKNEMFRKSLFRVWLFEDAIFHIDSIQTKIATLMRYDSYRTSHVFAALVIWILSSINNEGFNSHKCIPGYFYNDIGAFCHRFQLTLYSKTHPTPFRVK